MNNSQILEKLSLQAKDSLSRVDKAYNDVYSNKYQYRKCLVNNNTLQSVEQCESDIKIAAVDGGFILNEGVSCTTACISINGVGEDVEEYSFSLEMPHNVWLEDIVKMFMMMGEFIVANDLSKTHDIVMLDGCIQNHERIIKNGLDIIKLKNFHEIQKRWEDLNEEPYYLLESYKNLNINKNKIIGSSKLVTTHDLCYYIFGDNKELWPDWSILFDDKQIATILLETNEYLLYKSKNDNENFILILKTLESGVALKIMLPLHLLYKHGEIINWLKNQVVSSDIEEPYNIYLADKISKELVNNYTDVINQIWINLGGINYVRNHRTV